MNNERNNILILDNVPSNISSRDFTNSLNVSLEDVSKHKEDNNNLIKEDANLNNIDATK